MYMLENKICQKQDEMPASKKKKKDYGQEFAFQFIGIFHIMKPLDIIMHNSSEIEKKPSHIILMNGK